MMKLMRFMAILIVAMMFLVPRPASAASLVEVTNFGANPTNLRMYEYVPNSVTAQPAIVVAVHYCTGSGPALFSGTEFASLADQYGFIVVYPSATRSGGCFDVSTAGALTHNGNSDAVGIVSMVQSALQRHNGDPNRVFVTGVSSGAMMTNVLLGDYPDVFKAGAAFMGVPFFCFRTDDPSMWNNTCANGQSIKTPQEWGDLVRGAFPGYSGPRPRMQLWHGTDDTTLRYPNFAEEIKQWTNVFGISQTPSSTTNPKVGWTRTRYTDSSGNIDVEAFSIQGAGHSLPTSGMAAYALNFFGLAPNPDTVVENGFEDGTAQGWSPRGGVTLASVTEAAHGGSYSLKTSGRTANWNGPSLDVRTRLQKNAVYQISGYVRLVAGQAPTDLIFTVQRTPVGGSDQFDRVVASPANGVTDGGWVLLQGQYTYSTDVSGLVLYLESSSATSQYYLDDFNITLLSAPPPPPAGTVVQNDFEDGTAQGWIPRGAVTLASVTEAAHGGTHSLKTTGRTANFHGPSLDVRTRLQKGAVYQINGYVRLVAGQPASTLIFTVQRTLTDGTNQFDRVVASPNNGVTDGGWVQLQGQYTYSTDVNALLLYLESSDPTSQYYLDDFSITLVTPAPPDQSGLASDFEDGTTQGWQPRIGAEVLTVTTADAHGGTHSLLTTNRLQPYYGPSHNILDKMQKGSTYNISVWVKLAPGEAASMVRVSIQRGFQGTNSFDTVVGNTQITDAQWVHLAGSYTLNSDVDTLSIYVETNSELASYYIDDFTLAPVTVPPIQTDIPSVYQALANYFPIGAALEPNQLDDARHADLLKRHFNSIVAENVMKPGPIHPAENQFDWTGADKLVQFARANNMKMRGHTLVWHNQNPSWLFLDASGNPMQPTPENKALLLQRLEDHIRAVVGRYKDDIYAWDVVNEVIDPAQADCMRRSTWFTITGMDYIKTAFRVAHEVAPNAKLFINDYSTTDPVKRTCMYNLTRDLRAQGVPITSVGHQMHINIENPSAAAIEETIQLFAGLGVDQQMTEMDVSIYTNNTDDFGANVPQEVLVKQGYRYKAVFDVFKRHKDQISGVTMWGMADDHTWLKGFPITRRDLPLLFDEQLQAKHAYWGVVDPSHLPVLIQRQDVPKGTPKIDGKPELAWDMIPWTTVQPQNNLGLSFKTLWDAQYLYVLAEVQDATIDKQDALEIFVDGNNGKTTSYQADDAHYIVTRFNTHADGFLAHVKKLNTGYVVEAALPLGTAGATGRQIGFDLRVRDISQPGVPLSWNDPTSTQDTDTSRFGTLTLVDAVKLAIAAEAKRTITIDGLAEAAWDRAAEITTNTRVLGTGGATARVKTLWDSGHLYIFATVTDPILSKASPNAYEEDSIEIFVDQNNGKTVNYQPDDGQYRVNFDNEQSFGGAASAATFVTATRIVPGGYVVEAAITLNAVQLKKETLIGFDFQVNDDGQGNGVRSSVLTWNDPSGQSFQNTSKFGVLQLMTRAQ